MGMARPVAAAECVWCLQLFSLPLEDPPGAVLLCRKEKIAENMAKMPELLEAMKVSPGGVMRGQQRLRLPMYSATCMLAPVHLAGLHAFFAPCWFALCALSVGRHWSVLNECFSMFLDGFFQKRQKEAVASKTSKK